VMSKQIAVGEPGTLHHTFENMLIALARPIYASAEATIVHARLYL
jgi:hypothetical protein